MALQRHLEPKCWAVALRAGTPQGPHHLRDLSWLPVVSPAEDSSGTGQGLAAETLCTAALQNHPKGSAHTGQPCWDPKSGEVLCLCWERWAAWEETWKCSPLPGAAAEWGSKPAFPALTQPGRGARGATRWKVCAKAAERGELRAIPGSQLVFGRSGLLLLAGCNFSKGYFQAAGLRSKQLPVSVPGSSGGAVMCIGTPCPQPARGVRPKVPRTRQKCLNLVVFPAVAAEEGERAVALAGAGSRDTAWGAAGEAVTAWGRVPEPLRLEKLSKITLTLPGPTMSLNTASPGGRVHPRGAPHVPLHCPSHRLLCPPWLWRGKKANSAKCPP